jgi:hypothetical protein
MKDHTTYHHPDNIRWFVFNGENQLEAGPYTSRDDAEGEINNLLREQGDRNYRVVAGAS